MPRHVVRVIRTTTAALKGVSGEAIADLVVDSQEAEFQTEEEAREVFSRATDALFGLEDVPF